MCAPAPSHTRRQRCSVCPVVVTLKTQVQLWARGAEDISLCSLWEPARQRLPPLHPHPCPLALLTRARAGSRHSPEARPPACSPRTHSTVRVGVRKPAADSHAAHFEHKQQGEAKPSIHSKHQSRRAAPREGVVGGVRLFSERCFGSQHAPNWSPLKGTNPRYFTLFSPGTLC